MALSGTKIIKLDAAKKNSLKNDVIFKFADSALRTLAICYKDLDPNFNVNNIDERIFDNDLILIAIAGIKDPLRKEIPKAIKICTEKAGIKVRMVTGDNIVTAIAIARECGILDAGYKQDTHL
jgi:Ca2+ transporting ATPase